MSKIEDVSQVADNFETDLYLSIKAVVGQYPMDFLTCYNTLHSVTFKILNEEQTKAETIQTDQIMSEIKSRQVK